MSRSYKHTPIGAHTVSLSEKDDKRKYNRILRRNVKTSLYKYEEDDNTYWLDKKDVSNLYRMDKDGKHWFGNYSEKERYMRK